MYRDPYKDYVKIAPQNIMYDRRVVRGNTFAALVIPSSMQPDPAMMEKQQENKDKKEYEHSTQRHQQETIRRKMAEQNEEMLFKQQMEEENKERWDNLSNEEEAVREEDIDPDYVIDRPDTPEFIPNQEGIDKDTQVED